MNDATILKTEDMQLEMDLSKECQIPEKKEIENELDWQEIIPFKANLLPVEKLSKSMLPEDIYQYILSHSARLDKAPIEYAAISFLVSAASLIGNSIKIQPKRNDTSWRLPSVLWAISIGFPSSMKSPSQSAGISLIEYVQETIIDPQNAKNNLDYLVEEAIANKQVDKLKKEANEAFNDGNEDYTRELLRAAEMAQPTPPQDREVKISDFTLAALTQRLMKNPNGILLYRDELSGFFASLEGQQGAETRSFILQCFDASGNYTIERIIRGSIKLKDSNVSILGTIQPEMFRPIIADRENGVADDGLFERFQLCVLPDHNGAYTDIAPDENTTEAVRKVFSILAGLAEREEKIIFKFDDRAQKIWTQWATKLKERSLTVSTKLQTLLGKQAGLCAKFSLILHVLNEASNVDEPELFEPNTQINSETLKQALKWVDLMHSHSLRIQSYLNDEQKTVHAQLLIERLEDASIPSPFSCRDIYRNGWKGLKHKSDCDSAIQELVKRHYLAAIEVQGGHGKTLQRYIINPYLRKN
jgi:hypothetical protein